jgi:hypothetical protein
VAVLVMLIVMAVTMAEEVQEDRLQELLVVVA